MISRICIILCGFYGFLAVAGGAFGAHALKSRLSPEYLAVFETAIRYALFHALALLAVGALARQSESRSLRVAGWAFAAGVPLFSGSLVLLVGTGLKWLGAVTPLGGLCFLIGWAALTAFGLKRQQM